jgi:hypothetical protein
MAKPKYRKRVPNRKRRREHGGLPQMMVAVSAEPEFGGEARSLTSAYKYCNGEFVSAPMERIMLEAKRRLALQERAA